MITHMSAHTDPLAICVLGMHRSGTSTVTRGLNLLGAYLGEEKDLMRALPENPEGFWERLDLYYLHNRMLAVMKRGWDATAPLPERWHESDEIRPLKAELADLVSREFAGQPLWMWKDPRSCLLLPLWKNVLSELGIGLKVVFVVRNPLDVARSLEKRNGFTADKGLGIWFNHTLSALQGIEGLETVFLSYDRFLVDWETELKKCANGLGIDWPADESGIRAKMASFVRSDLRHSVSGLDELHAFNAPQPVIRLYGHLLDLLSGTVNLNAAGGMLDVLYQEFIGYARLFDFDMAALADCRSEEATASPEMLPAFAELEKELNTRTEWARKLDKELKAAREQVTSLQNSMSWTITRPLRLVHELLLKLRNGR